VPGTSALPSRLDSPAILSASSEAPPAGAGKDLQSFYSDPQKRQHSKPHLSLQVSEKVRVRKPDIADVLTFGQRQAFSLREQTKKETGGLVSHSVVIVTNDYLDNVKLNRCSGWRDW